MNRLILGLLLIPLTITSCYQVKKPEQPKDLISKDKMVNVILDMSLLTSSRGVDKNVLDKNGVSLQTLIYDKYDIDSLQLLKSSEYYSYHVKEYEGIYQIVNDSLKKLKDVYTEEKKRIDEEKRVKDSLAKQPLDSLKLKKAKRENIAVLDSLSFSKKEN